MKILKTLSTSASIVYWFTFIGFFVATTFFGSLVYKASFGTYVYPINILDSFADAEYIERGEEIDFTIVFDRNDSPCKITESRRRIISEAGDIIQAARANINQNLGTVSECEWNGEDHICNSLVYSFPEILGAGDYMVFNEIVVQCTPFFSQFEEVISAPGVPITVCEKGDFECLGR